MSVCPASSCHSEPMQEYLPGGAVQSLKRRLENFFDSTIEVALASRNRRRTASPSVGTREVFSFELGCSEAGCLSGTCELAPERRLLPRSPSGKGVSYGTGLPRSESARASIRNDTEENSRPVAASLKMAIRGAGQVDLKRLFYWEYINDRINITSDRSGTLSRRSR